ncbi:MAG TPA: DNA recombination protein RmuC [Xanthomonadales bacterium]|nr:DNA recombination protein RmuC [Xanthomonadales bacterium]
MNDWLISQGISTAQAGIWAGMLIGLLLAVLAAWISARKASQAERDRLAPEIADLEKRLDESRVQLSEVNQENASMLARSEERERNFQQQIRQLEQAELRLSEHFERLAGKIFEERSEKLSNLNRKQLDTLLSPLSEKLTEFRNTVTETHRQDTAQHQVLQSKLKDLEQLNERLHEDATHLTRALTTNVKAQGSWGEQQLERLLELAGLQKGQDYSTQFSVTTDDGQRVQPDLVVHLPEAKSIVLDSKVSLVAWTRYQSADSDHEQEKALKEHLVSIRQHIRSLAEKRYAELPGLDALDFVLMFVPVEAALIAALQADPELPVFALNHRIALISPTNFLATMRTVASVWAVHRQNRNAHEIARRAGLLYDKFCGFIDNLQRLGERLQQAQQSYDEAFGQLSSGAGNLVRQTEMLRELGARNTKQLEAGLAEQAGSESFAELAAFGELSDGEVTGAGTDDAQKS